MDRLESLFSHLTGSTFFLSWKSYFDILIWHPWVPIRVNELGALVSIWYWVQIDSHFPEWFFGLLVSISCYFKSYRTHFQSTSIHNFNRYCESSIYPVLSILVRRQFVNTRLFGTHVLHGNPICILKNCTTKLNKVWRFSICL